MLLRQLVEVVIKGDFGKKPSSGSPSGSAEIKHFSKNPGFDASDAKKLGMDIPAGYDRFEAEGNSIYGIKNGKRTKISTSSSPVLSRELTKLYNGGKSELKPISLVDAFGSPLMKAMQHEHVMFVDKPAYWEELDEKPITVLKFRRLEKVYKEMTGEPFKIFSSTDVFGYEMGARRGKMFSPLMNVKHMPKEDNCVITFADGTKYLVDTTQANTYIRMWLKIE